MITVSVLILTYRRPELLKDCLKSILEQQLSPKISLQEIIVIDNDVAKSAAHVVDLFRKSAYPIRYKSNPEKNLAILRNDAIRSGSGDYLLFIDDDETASNNWIAHLIAIGELYQADIVSGPVISKLMSCESKRYHWIDFNKLLCRPRWESGTPVCPTGTGNCAIRRDFLRRTHLQFNTQYAKAGEDTKFFSDAAQIGAKMVWADDAIVYEAYFGERATIRYLMKRTFQSGYLYGKMQIESTTYLRPLYIFIATAAVSIAVSRLFCSIVLAPIAPTTAIRAVMRAVRALGRSLALFQYAVR